MVLDLVACLRTHDTHLPKFPPKEAFRSLFLPTVEDFDVGTRGVGLKCRLFALRIRGICEGVARRKRWPATTIVSSITDSSTAKLVIACRFKRAEFICPVWKLFCFWNQATLRKTVTKRATLPFF